MSIRPRNKSGVYVAAVIAGIVLGYMAYMIAYPRAPDHPGHVPEKLLLPSNVRIHTYAPMETTAPPSILKQQYYVHGPRIYGEVVVHVPANVTTFTLTDFPKADPAEGLGALPFTGDLSLDTSEWVYNPQKHSFDHVDSFRQHASDVTLTYAYDHPDTLQMNQFHYTTQ